MRVGIKWPHRMPKKKPHVVPISEQPGRVIAQDDDPLTGQSRMIMAIGKQRFAFDLTATVSEVAPGTGDNPAKVRRMKKRT